jgi:ribosomal protein L12E/L44/L45/RPP1/RPP2
MDPLGRAVVVSEMSGLTTGCDTGTSEKDDDDEEEEEEEDEDEDEEEAGDTIEGWNG